MNFITESLSWVAAIALCSWGFSVWLGLVIRITRYAWGAF